MAAVGIIGAGTWGTALAVLLNNNGHDVTIWSAFDTEIQEMSRTRRHKNLPEVVLPDPIQMTADLRTAMAEKDMLIMAVPSVYVRSTAAKMKEYLRYGQIVVGCGEGNRGAESYDDVTGHRGGTSAGGGGRPFRTEPCRGGEPGTSDYLCGSGAPQKDCRVHAECVHESGVPHLHQPGHAGRRDWCGS